MDECYKTASNNNNHQILFVNFLNVETSIRQRIEISSNSNTSLKATVKKLRSGYRFIRHYYEIQIIRSIQGIAFHLESFLDQNVQRMKSTKQYLPAFRKLIFLPFAAVDMQIFQGKHKMNCSYPFLFCSS
ncbi:CLUMA_CG017511, isoform A [Clunio marinus]|uniref:CLUMA_CG017511, isoform A n=1 Tax=Clunio marinus TaxID=568069 RepID=A0A1J1IXI3_9DIPT|nr:CLUMA_CG017511, isoform A [Clunio marinus]